MSDRGAKIPLPRWWVNIARDLVRLDENGHERSSRELEELGEELGKAIGRTSGWSRTVLAKFAKVTADDGEDYELVEETTFELAKAIQLRFPHTPSAIYIPRSLSESLRMQKIKDEYDRKPPEESGGKVHNLDTARPGKREVGHAVRSPKRVAKG